MTVNEVAELLGIAPATVRQQARNGVLKARKMGRDWYITQGQVEAYRAKHLGRIGRPAKA